MKVIDILTRYRERFDAQYGGVTTPDQWSALNAMLGCRTGQYGEVKLTCAACETDYRVYQSCGHRACNQCQNHTTTQWLERQQTKLLPVNYFMVTFTVPFELRQFAKARQKTFYSALFDCATRTLKEFGLNDKKLASELGMTGVLHTHTRRLDYHPHIHFMVPAGGLDKGRKQWRKRNGQYLFKEQNLATVFRGKMLSALKQTGLSIPDTPKQWIVDCQSVGHGLSALKYLSRYLYRGVISNRNILADNGQEVTFQYTESKTGTVKQRTLRGEDFMALLLQHTLPKGFRRARDYGFLHGNAKKRLQLVQLMLRVILPALTLKERPSFTCRHCLEKLNVSEFIAPG